MEIGLKIVGRMMTNEITIWLERDRLRARLISESWLGEVLMRGGLGFDEVERVIVVVVGGGG